jgi:hypothetical protein
MTSINFYLNPYEVEPEKFVFHLRAFPGIEIENSVNKLNCTFVGLWYVCRCLIGMIYHALEHRDAPEL